MNTHAQLHTRQTGLHSSISTTKWSQRGHPEYTWEKPLGGRGTVSDPLGAYTAHQTPGPSDRTYIHRWNQSVNQSINQRIYYKHKTDVHGARDERNESITLLKR